MNLKKLSWAALGLVGLVVVIMGGRLGLDWWNSHNAGHLLDPAVVARAARVVLSGPQAEAEFPPGFPQRPGPKPISDQPKTVLTTTLVNKDGMWVVADKNGFPADTQGLTRLLLELSQEKTGEVVGEGLETLADLSLLLPEEAVGSYTPAEVGTQLTVLDAAGNPIYRLVMGRGRGGDTSGEAGSAGGTYIRFADEKTARLVFSNLHLETDPNRWLAASPWRFNGDQDVIRLELRPAGGGTLVFTRKDPKSEWSSPQGTPAGAVVRNSAGQMGQTALRGLWSGAPLPAKISQIEVELTDGRIYRMTLGGKADAQGRMAATLEAALAERVKDNKDMKAQADAFNRGFKGRLVAVDAYTQQTLFPPSKDLLKAK
ncbi:MAG: DUF4340 domain-containing protein [Deltaproteobacteria bacterium]|nr:DUF4340 domain-containing protein [Deltaproteobacteria bacterium]